MSNYLARHSNPVEGRGAMRNRNDSYILRHKMGFCLNVERGLLRTTVVKSVFRSIQQEILMSWVSLEN
jgi:hypothetical protein